MKKILVFLTIAAMLLMVFAGCSATKSDGGDYYATGEAAEMPMPAAEDASAEAASPQESAAPASGEAGLNYDSAILSPDVSRKIVYYGSFQIRTKNFDADYDSLLAALNQLGGYIESSSVSGSKPEKWDDAGRYASLTLRVPSGKFSQFTGMLGSLGETISSSVSGQDISLQYFDTETKLKTLRTRETRLMDLLNKATTMEDIVELEKALGDVSYEIQMLETNLRDFDSLIDYSTVTIEMQEVNQVAEVSPPDEGIGTRISNAFYSVLNVLADFGEFLLVFFIGGAPIIVPLAAVAVLIIILVKRRKKKALPQVNTPDNVK